MLEGFLQIGIVSGSSPVRQKIRSLLQNYSTWAIVGDASDGPSAVELARALRPHLLILEAELPQRSGVEAARHIRATTNCQVLLLAATGTKLLIRQALDAGAHGVIGLGEIEENLVPAVVDVAAGKIHVRCRVSPVPAGTAAHLHAELHAPPASQLSPRELETVILMCAGKSNKEIAAEMSISVRTVEAYRAAVRDRLGIHSTGELIRWAVRNHLVQA